MEKISIGKKKVLYEIESIQPFTINVLQIKFANNVPAAWGDITIFTEGDLEITTLTGYDTMYRDEGQVVYLSNDGSVYTPPETSEGPIDPPEPYEPTLDELKVSKRREVSSACEQVVYAGVNVTLLDGTSEHFSLTAHDQLNLFGKQVQLASGSDQIEYHADGQPCRYYPAVDMQAIVTTAMWHVSYHTTYCNAINMWIAGCETTEEIQAIFYGADVPKEYRSEVLNTYLSQIAEMAGDNDETDG